MPLTPISLGTRSNPGRYGADGAARLINCYAEDAGAEGKIQYPIYASDGFVTWTTISGGVGPIRASVNIDDVSLYVLCGSTIYKINTSGTVTTLSGTISASGYATMVRNRRDPNPQIGIVTSDGHYYLIDTTDDSITSPTLPDGAPPPISIATIDGYFVLFCADGTFYITAIDNGANIDGLDFSSAESNPDGGVVVTVRGRDLVLFGPHSVEFWNDTGSGDFPFSRVSASEIGLFAAKTVTGLVIPSGGSTQDSIAFIGSDANGFYAGVMLLDGYSGAKISTGAVDRAIRDEPDQSSLRGFSWADGGHVFYAVTGSSFTWVYDLTTNFWHERKSDGLNSWRIINALRFGGKTLVADYTLPKLYEMRHDLFDEDGTQISVTIQPPAVHAWPNRLRFFSIHIDVVPGVGLAIGADGDVNPTITLQHSNDNGKTWSPARVRPIGAAGQKKVRVKINRIGQSLEDGKVFRYIMTARVARTITGAAVDAVTLAN